MTRSEKLLEDLLRETNIAIQTYLGKDINSEEREELYSVANSSKFQEFVKDSKAKTILKNIQATTYAPMSMEYLANYLGIKR